MMGLVRAYASQNSSGHIVRLEAAVEVVFRAER